MTVSIHHVSLRYVRISYTVVNLTVSQQLCCNHSHTRRLSTVSYRGMMSLSRQVVTKRPPGCNNRAPQGRQSASTRQVKLHDSRHGLATHDCKDPMQTSNTATGWRTYTHSLPLLGRLHPAQLRSSRQQPTLQETAVDRFSASTH